MGQGATLRVEIGIHGIEDSNTVSQKKYIDANSTLSGDYKNKISDNPPAFVTDEGLKLIEEYKKQDKTQKPEMTIQQDASWLYDWWNNIKEEGIGKLQ